MARWKQGHITPAQVIMAGFGAIILAGTLLLCLPFATASGHSGLYDLQGRRISTPQKGMYIHNGKVYIKK